MMNAQSPDDKSSKENNAEGKGDGNKGLEFLNAPSTSTQVESTGNVGGGAREA